MATSLVYRNALLYELFIKLLYRRNYSARYRSITELIPAEASVLDLCCGPAALYEHLRDKSVTYTGLDLNPGFIDRLVGRGGQGMVWDLHGDAPLPAADFAIMQGGLLYFLPDPAPLVDRMLEAARKQVIVSEAIRNLASSRVPLIRWIARRSTDAGLGPTPQRFTEPTLDAFFQRYASRVSRSFLIPGGREKVYVLNKEAQG